MYVTPIAFVLTACCALLLFSAGAPNHTQVGVSLMLYGFILSAFG